jgi:hypothetical protein
VCATIHVSRPFYGHFAAIRKRKIFIIVGVVNDLIDVGAIAAIVVVITVAVIFVAVGGVVVSGRYAPDATL